MANTLHKGMLTGRKIFFHNVKKSSSIDKIKRIFKRLGAEIVEIYDDVNIDIVITDEMSQSINHSTDRKRKNNSPIGFQPKRKRLDSCIKNILLHNKINESIENSNNNNNNLNFKRSDSTFSHFLSIAKDKGWKIKSTNEVWQWLSKYYKWLVENDEPDEPIYRNPNLDSYYHIKYLNWPALKICDPFGDAQPLILENYCIEKLFLLEFINEEHDVSSELRRKSISTWRKMGKNDHNNYQSGYCENCREYFQYLYQHISSTQHRSFAENNANFQEIDQFLEQSPIISDFFINRKSLWDQHKKSKISLFSLPSSMKQISIHDNPDNSLHLKSRLPSPKQINVESDSSSSDTDSDSSSNESSTESDSSSTESKTNVKITKNLISSTPINKLQKPNFFSHDSISTEDQQQSEISSHVNDIIENLDSQLSTYGDYDEFYPQLNRLLCSNCSKDSPIISRRFDWCKECKRNHVPVDNIDSYHCQLSPLKVENCIIESSKSPQFSVDIDESFNNVEPDRNLSSTSNKFSKSSVREIIDLNVNTVISNNISDNIPNAIISNHREDGDIAHHNFNNNTFTTHLIKRKANDYFAPPLVDGIITEKVVQNQEPIDGIDRICNDCSGNSVLSILSNIDNENNSQITEREDCSEINSKLIEICLTNDRINNKFEYHSTTSDISEVEIPNDNNSQLLDTIVRIPSEQELNSRSSSPANILFIPCSVNLEKINYVNVQNVLTKSANEINFHPESELNEEQNDLHQQTPARINICTKFKLSNSDSFDCISDKDSSASNYCSENICQSNNFKSNSKNLSVRKPRKPLELRGDLDINSPISGKRKAAIAANRGIENANNFFDKDIRKTIKTLQDTYEPFVYHPREILNKLNYSPNSSNGNSKKLLKERNV